MRGVLFSFCYDGSLRWSESLSLFQLMGEFTRSIQWGIFRKFFTFGLQQLNVWFLRGLSLTSFSEAVIQNFSTSNFRFSNKGLLLNTEVLKVWGQKMQLVELCETKLWGISNLHEGAETAL